MEAAKEYENVKSNNPSFLSFYDRFAQSIIKGMDWRSGDIIMDYGCGTGQFATKYLTNVAKSVKIYGVDVSTSMIDFAKNNYKPESTITFSVGDIMGDDENWNFANGSIDKFISYLVLIYIQDYKLWFEKVFELLKPDGEIGLLVPFSKAIGIPNQLLASPKWNCYDQNERMKIANWGYEIETGIVNFKESLEAAGFQILKYEVEDVPFDFGSIKELCDFLNVVSAASSQIPKQAEANFMEDMATYAANRLEISPNGKNGIRYNWTFVKIVAKK